MKNSIIAVWLITAFLFFVGAWPIALIFLLIGINMSVNEKKKAHQESIQDEEMERQREAERKEVEMVRKSNEILLHLIQDQNRDKDGE